MSSHHVVRDEQEPALLVTAPGLIHHPVLAALLEWSPVVVAFESALPELMTQNLKIDVAVVNAGELEKWKLALADQVPIKIITFQEPEDQLPSALALLHRNDHDAAHILINRSGEGLVDHLREMLPVLPTLDLVFYSGEWKASLVDQTYRKWYAQDQSLRVTPVSTSSWNLSINGKSDHFSDQQTFCPPEDGFVEVAPVKGYLLVEEGL